MRRSLPLLVLVLVLSSCGGDSDDAFIELPEISVTTTSTTTAPTTTTTSAPATTTTTEVPTTTTTPATTTTTRPWPRPVEAIVAVADFYQGMFEGDGARALANLSSDPGFDLGAPSVAAAVGLFDGMDVESTTEVYDAARYGETAPIANASLDCQDRRHVAFSERLAADGDRRPGEFEIDCFELAADEFWTPLGVPTFGTVVWAHGPEGLRIAGGEPSWLGHQAGAAGDAARAALAGFEEWAGNRLPEPWLGWAAGHRYPFAAEQAEVAIRLVEEYVAAGGAPATVALQPSADAQRVLDAYAALADGELGAATEPVSRHGYETLRDLFDHLDGRVWAECEVEGAGGPVEIVMCTEHMEDAFYGPAGIFPTSDVAWLTADSIVREIWQRGDGRVFQHLNETMSIYLQRFGTWLKENHAEIYRESGYTPHPCGCFPFPDPSTAADVLDLVPAFLAQSPDYPLQP